MNNPLVNIPDSKIPDIQLIRDVNKHLLRGHRWIFADCFSDNTPSGLAILKSRKDTIAVGLVQADTQLRFRLLFLCEEPYVRMNNIPETLQKWSEIQFGRALELRAGFRSEETNSFRLISGEGDGMPGLVIDIYNDTAVIKHDHPVCERFYNHAGLAERIQKEMPYIKNVYYKRRNDEEVKGVNIVGTLPAEVIFKENGSYFASNIKDAAKTGFFLDQRDNRKLIGQFSKNKTVLNLFSYTGGFSIFAAHGGATEVTSVDIAKAAIEASTRNFEVNNLSTKHNAIAADALLWIDEQIKLKNKWDLVITDPPSFAPNQKAVETATAAYTKVFASSLKLVKGNGLFAASSCSSHISNDMFLDICREAFSKTRKKGTLVYMGGQPFDHPYPLAMDELRYLKFALFRVD